MLIKKVEAQGFGPFEDISIILQAGIYGLLGKNGHGKSSFFDIIRFAFFEYSRDGNLSEIAHRYLKPKKNPVVRVSFQIGESSFEVVRSRKLFNEKGEQLKIEKPFAELHSGMSDDLTLIASGEEVSAKIQELLGMTERVFLNTSFFQQEVQDEFLNGKPADRVSFVQEYFDLSIFNKAQKGVKQGMVEIRDNLNQAEGSLSTLNEIVGDTNIQALTKEVTTAKELMEKAKLEADKLTNKVQLLTEVKRDRTNYIDKKNQKESFEIKIRKAESEIQEKNKVTEDESGDLYQKRIQSAQNALTDSNKHLSVVQHKVGKVEGEVSSLLNNIKILQNARGYQCPICLSDLGKDKAAELLDQYKKQLVKWEQDISKGKDVCHSKEQKIKELNKFVSRLNQEQLSYEKLITGSDSLILALSNLKEESKRISVEMDVLKKKWVDNAEAKQDLNEVQTFLNEQLSHIGKYKEVLSNNEQLVQKHKDNKKKVINLQRKIKRLEGELEIKSILVQAFDKYGAPSDVTELIIKKIEDYSNEELEKLNANMVVRFDNFVTTKHSTKPGIEIWIHDKGESARYRTYSGGEKSLVNFAVRIGMSQTLQELMGVQTSSLFLDEVMGKLDDDNRACLTRVVQSLRNKFQQVLFITHTELKREFDNTIEFEKDDQGVSEVVV